MSAHLLNDIEIEKLCLGDSPLISPFVSHQVREHEGKKCVSYGLSTCGYDIRADLSKGKYVRPYQSKLLHTSEYSATKVAEVGNEDIEYVTIDLNTTPIPPMTTIYLNSIERFNFPRNVAARIMSKSTNARSGLIALTTVAEPGWDGFLVLELFNSNPFALKLNYGGIAQMQFEEINEPREAYSDRIDKNGNKVVGKYQNQTNTDVVMAKL